LSPVSLLVEITILHATARQNATEVLRDAATAYKVDVDAIGVKVKQEFAAKEKTQATKQGVVKAQSLLRPWQVRRILKKTGRTRNCSILLTFTLSASSSPPNLNKSAVNGILG
jgi:hypothetical protein